LQNRQPIEPGRQAAYAGRMFTIEHDFDATVITLVDEGGPALEEDVIILAFDDCVTVEQFDPRRDEVVKITLSRVQLSELAAALNLPEGSYRLQNKP
jgi:hydrogenase maturation factor HypF (carbamoyltransferase family)